MTIEELIPLIGRPGAEFVEFYFRKYGQQFTIERFVKITYDELIDSWLSMNTVIRIERLQISLKQAHKL